MNTRSKKEKLPYSEGTWFAIPLRQGGYAIGRVARHSGNGCILAYFFGPKRLSVPPIGELEALTPDTSIKVLRAGDLGIIEGRWPIIGNSREWRREDWPIPALIRRDDLSKTAWLVQYADDDPLKQISKQRVPFDICGYYREALSGAKAAEVHVSNALS